MERAVFIYKQINRPPIKGNLERNLRNVPFNANLPGDTRMQIAVVRMVVETQIGAGTQIEIAKAVAGKDEVVDTDDIEIVGVPAEV
jgi:hypothetical protein